MVFLHKKLCIIYIGTAFLIAILISHFLTTFYEQRAEIEKLRDDLNALALRQTSKTGKCAGGQADGGVKCSGGKCGGKCDKKSTEDSEKLLTDCLDNSVSKKFADIWDNLLKIKKQIQTLDCTRNTNAINQSDPPHCQNNIDKPAPAIQVRVNYATEDLGAKIVNVCAEPIGGSNLFRELLNLDYITNPPINMLRSSMEPGNCFGFQSPSAVIQIQLGKEVYVDSFELEHVPAKLSPTGETTSAPKDFDVFVINKLNDGNPIPIGSFTYANNPKKLAQTFALKTVTKVNSLQFIFRTNHGNPKYTCIYRLAVYGSLTI